MAYSSVVFQGLVVKQVLPQQDGQSYEQWELLRKRCEAAIEVEVDMLRRIQRADKGTGVQQWVVGIEAAPTINGSKAILMKDLDDW